MLARPDRTAATTLGRQLLLVALVGVPVAVLDVALWGRVAADQAQLNSRQVRAAQVAVDASAVAAMRDRPKLASEVGLAAGDLLARAEQAMRTAGMPREALASTLPQPARRIEGTEQVETGVVLMFEKVTIEQLVRLCRALECDGAALRVTGLALRPSAGEASKWSADVTVAQWTVARSLTGPRGH